MPKQMHAAVAIDLHADEFREAQEKLDFKPLWDAFLAGLVEKQIKHTFKLETIETRAKVERKPRQPRTPRAATGATDAGAGGE